MVGESDAEQLLSELQSSPQEETLPDVETSPEGGAESKLEDALPMVGESDAEQLPSELESLPQEESLPDLETLRELVAARRRQRVHLPVDDMLDEIRKAVETRRVNVIVGGTGCGKSTRVSQYILDEAESMGVTANVLVTQPRRMAAVSLARRVADERGERVGEEIGYRIRGDSMPGRQLSFVTAGYLLSWFTVEPSLFASVTHIILDEAHERDAQFELLILLVRLLMRIYKGPRIILMSATLQSNFFQNYFKEFTKPAPEISVGSRRYPVEALFLDDLANGILPHSLQMPPELLNTAEMCLNQFSKAVPRIPAELRQFTVGLIPAVAEAGTTILIFVPGYADLVRLHSLLRWTLPIVSAVTVGTTQDANASDVQKDSLLSLNDAGMSEAGLKGKLRGYRLFALHSQIASEDQDLVLEAPEPDICHVVLATTVAESSLTLPDVCGIIDFGVHKTTITDPKQPALLTLSQQWCCKDSLVQREGRAGRTRPGWCLRLIPRDFYANSVEVQNTPEIQRTPLTKLYLQTKGISDALLRAVREHEDAALRLALSDTSARNLLGQLPSPAMTGSINSAIRELAELGLLSHEDDAAEVTALGKIALHLPCDLRLCRLIWLGALWGCVPEAVVLAAACSVNPFLTPTRLSYSDDHEFAEELTQAAESRGYFDGGHFSEPIMGLRLFCSWARRLTISPAKLNHQGKWFRATKSLGETAAIDESKMQAFVGWISDIAIKSRDMCSDARDENECPTRRDLHLLLQLLRRPDLSYKEQRERPPELAPRVGEVFRAPASKLYALLAAAFSDQILIGGHAHKTAASQEALQSMFDALEMLRENGVASQDAILIPTTREKFSGSLYKSRQDTQRIITTYCGAQPNQIAVSEEYMACCFAHEKGENKTETTTPVWLQDSEAVQDWATKADLRNMGLPPAAKIRLTGLASRPRTIMMATGGLRTAFIEDAEVMRATSPY
jgi:HrpA-like RNA helicase